MREFRTHGCTGMHLARSVLESAQQNNTNFESPSGSADLIRDERRGTASSDTRAVLPSRDTANNLIDIFFSQYQVQYPILAEKEFTRTVADFYDRQNGAGQPAPADVWTRFMLNMVFAISLVSLSRENHESLAMSKGFTTNAMADLSLIMQTKNVQTMQCLLLLLLSSILDSSSAPVWYISGLCIRMCVDLGYHSEATILISSSESGNKTEQDNEADTKRRLFWVTYSFDRTLSILLGRPFTFDDSMADIHLPGSSLLPHRRPQVLHWLELQRLQSEIVHKLHVVRDSKSRGDEPELDLSSWTINMADRLEAWNAAAQSLTDSDGHDINWWGYWYRTALLILYRPSSSRPNLSGADMSSCYLAAKNLIQLSFLRISEGLTDFTWVDLHYQFMSGITLVFIVWKNAEARAQAKSDWVSFKSCLFQWKLILERLGVRWERIARAREALAKLADATSDLVEKEMTRPSTMGQVAPMQHQREETRRDRRRSIMQQLRPTDLRTSLQHAASSVAVDDQTRLDASSCATVGGIGENGIFQPREGSMVSQTQQQGGHPAQASQPTSRDWAVLDGQADPQQNFFGDMQPPGDISAMLTDELWPPFDFSDNATTSDDLAFWTYFSAPMLGVDDANSSHFNSNARPDGPFTNSILNFHGDMNNLSPEMQVDYTDDGRYGQDYSSTQQ